MAGQFLRRGEELFQVHSEHRLVRIVLTDHELSRTRLETGSEAEVRWVCDPARSVRGVVREIRRSASRQRVPVPLTMVAGGDVHVQPLGDRTVFPPKRSGAARSLWDSS